MDFLLEMGPANGIQKNLCLEEESLWLVHQLLIQQNIGGAHNTKTNRQNYESYPIFGQKHSRIVKPWGEYHQECFVGRFLSRKEDKKQSEEGSSGNGKDASQAQLVGRECFG